MTDIVVTPPAGTDNSGQVPVVTPPTTPPAQAAEGLDATKAAELLDQKRKANAEAQAAKKEAAALQKRVDEFEAAEAEKKKASMDEVDRAKAEAEEANAKTAALQLKLDTTTRETAARDAGVLTKYASYAAQQLAAAQEADPEKKAADFFKEFKADNPELYNGKTPALGSAQGGPPDGTRPGKYTAQIEAEKAKLAASKDRNERIYITRGIKALERQAAQETN